MITVADIKMDLEKIESDEAKFQYLGNMVQELQRLMEIIQVKHSVPFGEIVAEEETPEEQPAVQLEETTDAVCE